MIDTAELLHLETLQQVRNPEDTYYYDPLWWRLFSEIRTYVLPQVLMYLLDYFRESLSYELTLRISHTRLKSFIEKASNKEVSQACALQHIAKLKEVGILFQSDKRYSKNSYYSFNVAALLPETYLTDIEECQISKERKSYFKKHLIQYIYYKMSCTNSFVPVFKTLASALPFKEALILSSIVNKRPLFYQRDFIDADRFWLQLGYLSKCTGLYPHLVSKTFDKLQHRGLIDTVNTLQRRFVYENKKSVWQLRERKWIKIHYKAFICLLSFNMRSIIDPSVYNRINLTERIKISLDNYYTDQKEVKRVEETYEDPEGMKALFEKTKQADWVYWHPIYMRKKFECAKRTLPRPIAYIASAYEAFSQYAYQDYRPSVNAYRQTGKNYRAYEKLSKFITERGYSPYVYMYAQFFAPNEQLEWKKPKTRPFLNTLRSKACEDRYHALLATVLSKYDYETKFVPHLMCIPQIALIEDIRLRKDPLQGFKEIYNTHIKNVYTSYTEKSLEQAELVLEERKQYGDKTVNLLELFTSDIETYSKEVQESDLATWIETKTKTFVLQGYTLVEFSPDIIAAQLGRGEAFIFNGFGYEHNILKDYFIRNGIVIKTHSSQTQEEAEQSCRRDSSWRLGVCSSYSNYTEVKKSFMQVNNLTEEQFIELERSEKNLLKFTDNMVRTEFENQALRHFNIAEYSRDSNLRYPHEVTEQGTILTEPGALPVSLVEFAKYSRKFQIELLHKFGTSDLSLLLVYQRTPLETVLSLADTYSDFKHFRAYEEKKYRSFSPLLSVN